MSKKVQKISKRNKQKTKTRPNWHLSLTVPVRVFPISFSPPNPFPSRSHGDKIENDWGATHGDYQSAVRYGQLIGSVCDSWWYATDTFGFFVDPIKNGLGSRGSLFGRFLNWGLHMAWWLDGGFFKCEDLGMDFEILAGFLAIWGKVGRKVMNSMGYFDAKDSMFFFMRVLGTE